MNSCGWSHLTTDLNLARVIVPLQRRLPREAELPGRRRQVPRRRRGNQRVERAQCLRAHSNKGTREMDDKRKDNTGV